MAKMYPKTFPEDSLSSGERKVFEYLKEYAPQDWFVLHSFRLPKHKAVVFGEADFVVIAPQFGVFILEIKSGGVGFDGSEWIFVNRNHEMTYKKRGPFQQGHDAMFEVERIIVEKLGSSYCRTNILYGYGVIFTDEADFPVSAITEDESWRLCQKNDNINYVEFIKRLYKKFVEELQQIGKQIPAKITSIMAETIAKTLRPFVDCVVPLKSFVQKTEEDIISLTEEQYACLDDIELNDQMVITGGAGTGKTLIAVEEARRCAKKESVALFCYNKNLAEFLKHNLYNTDISVYSLHLYLSKICGTLLDGFEKTENFFEKIMPQMACKVIEEKGVCFDRLIVDEFQDLCTEDYLIFFDKLLKNGLMEGKFTFYGDFARQAIYKEKVSLATLKKFAFFARKHLSVNCRNTLFIGNELINISGYEDKQYKLKITGEPVDFFVWDTEQEQMTKMLACIKDLKNKGFQSSSITILSPKKRDNSIVGKSDPEEFVIGNYGVDCSPYLAMFSTIQSFKGLESEIVIVADVEDYCDQRLMYIALSRARSKLIVLESRKASKQRKKLVIAR